MRIVSNFKDYYDSLQAYGQTSDVVFVRDEIKLKESYEQKFPQFYCNNFSGLLKSPEYLLGHVVGFCGKIYYCIEYKNFNFGTKKDQSKCFYDFESLDSFLLSVFDKKQVELYTGKLRWRGTYQKDLKDYFEGKDGNFYRDSIKQGDESFKELFFELKTPIFVRVQGYHFKKEYSFYINARLNKYEFYKVFQPQQTYQEISMFIGGVLANPEKPIPQPSDDVMRDIKGFDKWSFRKEPQK